MFVQRGSRILIYLITVSLFDIRKKHLPVHTPTLAYFPVGQVTITQKSDCKHHFNLLFYCATNLISDISQISFK